MHIAQEAGLIIDLGSEARAGRPSLIAGLPSARREGLISVALPAVRAGGPMVTPPRAARAKGPYPVTPPTRPGVDVPSPWAGPRPMAITRRVVLGREAVAVVGLIKTPGVGEAQPTGPLTSPGVASAVRVAARAGLLAPPVPALTKGAGPTAPTRDPTAFPLAHGAGLLATSCAEPTADVGPAAIVAP